MTPSHGINAQRSLQRSQSGQMASALEIKRSASFFACLSSISPSKSTEWVAHGRCVLTSNFTPAFVTAFRYQLQTGGCDTQCQSVDRKWTISASPHPFVRSVPKYASRWACQTSRLHTNGLSPNLNLSIAVAGWKINMLCVIVNSRV